MERPFGCLKIEYCYYYIVQSRGCGLEFVNKMAYFYKTADKDAVKAFIYEDLKVLGVKIPKLDKIAKEAEKTRLLTSMSAAECTSSSHDEMVSKLKNYYAKT